MTFRGPIVPVLPRRGLNNADDPVTLEEGYSPDCLNVRFDKRGVYKRDGFTKYISSTVASAHVTGIAQLNLSTGSNEQVALAGTALVKESAGAWSSIKGALTLTSGQNNHVAFAQLTDLLIGTNNVDQVWKWSGTGNAAALGGSPPTTVKGLETFKNYLLTLNTLEGGTRRPGRFRWSDLNNAESWTSANYNDLLNNAGQVGQGLRKVGDQCLAFFDRSIVEVVYTGNASSPFAFPTVCPDIGSVSGHALVATDDGVFFPSPRGIHFMPIGGIPRYIGARVEGTWQTINTGRLANIVGVHNRLYNEVWFAISTGSNSSHDTVLVFDYLNDTWTVFSGVTINAFGQFPASLPFNIMAGTSSGYVMKGNSGSYNDDGAAITAYCSTKPLPLGDAGRKRQVKRIQAILESESASGATLTIPYSYDLNPMTNQVAVSMASSGSVYDTATFDSSTFAQEGQLVRFARPLGHGRLFQMQIRNSQLDTAMRVAETLLWFNGEGGR